MATAPAATYTFAQFSEDVEALAITPSSITAMVKYDGTTPAMLRTALEQITPILCRATNQRQNFEPALDRLYGVGDEFPQIDETTRSNAHSIALDRAQRWYWDIAIAVDLVAALKWFAVDSPERFDCGLIEANFEKAVSAIKAQKPFDGEKAQRYIVRERSHITPVAVPPPFDDPATDDGRYTITELCDKYDIRSKKDSFDKQVRRWKDEHPPLEDTDWFKITQTRKNKAQFIFRAAAVSHLIIEYRDQT